MLVIQQSLPSAIQGRPALATYVGSQIIFGWNFCIDRTGASFFVTVFEARSTKQLQSMNNQSRQFPANVLENTKEKTYANGWLARIMGAKVAATTA